MTPTDDPTLRGLTHEQQAEHEAKRSRCIALAALAASVYPVPMFREEHKLTIPPIKRRKKKKGWQK